jgi:hypothetical protein
MGGKAFTHGPNPLNTPRMPTAIYLPLRTTYLKILSTFYRNVASPIDAPEKETYGDIDILASNPINAVVDIETLRQPLNAKAVFCAGGSKFSFAVPYPDTTDRYIQVDLHICAEEHFQWELFIASHGDLWNIISTSLRVIGLSSNDIGLFLRIEEIEKVYRKKCRLFLTADPTAVLELLRLDVDRFWRPFETKNELCRYIIGMRFFKHEEYTMEIMGSKDRRRLESRPLYKYFVEWLEGDADVEKPNEGETFTRASVLSEVLERYNKQGEYDGMLQAFYRELAELQAKQLAKAMKKADGRAEFAYAEAWMDISSNKE